MNAHVHHSEAVGWAADAAAGWRIAVHAQRTATPHHGDFHDLSEHVIGTLRALDALACVLLRQVIGYGDGRDVYDDAGAVPHYRLRSAGLALAELRQHTAEAERAADRFGSAIGHIGVRPKRTGGRSR